MTASKLIEVLKGRGLRLALVGDKLKASPRGLLTDDDLVQIKKLKDELLLLLSQRQAATDRDNLTKPAPSRPPGYPKWGVTKSIRVVELAKLTPSEQAKDPVIKVAAEGWDQWYPVQPGDLPRSKKRSVGVSKNFKSGQELDARPEIYGNHKS